jgi:glycosyltransferase involved in cell wall biosynthesis
MGDDSTTHSDTGVRPLVSIGLPVYNGQETIKRALGSLVDQTYENIEIIVSDNASTDRTLHLCKRILRDHPKARILEQPTNCGPHANFAAVLDAAQGEFFMWAADDDSWHPDFVRRMMDELQSNPSACVAMCGTDLRDEAGKRIDVIRFEGRADPNGLPPSRLGALVLTPRKYNYFIYGLYRTEILRKGMKTFPPVLGGDRIFVAQFAIGHRFRYVDDLLYRRTDRPKHRDGYKREEAKAEVRFGQVKAFARTIAASEVLPLWRKFGLPLYTLLYARFVYRKQLAQADKSLATLQRRVIEALRNRGWMVGSAAAALMGVALGGSLSGLAPATWSGPLAAGLALIAAGMLLALRSELRAQRGLINSVSRDLRGVGKTLALEHRQASNWRAEHLNALGARLDEAIRGLASRLEERTDALRNDLGEDTRITLERELATVLERSAEQLQRAIREAVDPLFKTRLRPMLAEAADLIRARIGEDDQHRLETSGRSIMREDLHAEIDARLAEATTELRRAIETQAVQTHRQLTAPALAEFADLIRSRVGGDSSSYLRERILPAVSGIADVVRERVAEDTRAQLERIVGAASSDGERGLEERLARIERELKYATDLLLSPPDSLDGQLEAPGLDFDGNRRNLIRKEIKFARLLQQSRIRELGLHEIFPGIDEVTAPIGALQAGGSGATDMLLVCAMAKLRSARSILVLGARDDRAIKALAQASPRSRLTALDSPAEAQGWYDFVIVASEHGESHTDVAFRMLTPGGVIVWRDFAARSERLAEFVRDFTTAGRPLFRISRTSLLLHIDGVDPFEFQPAPPERAPEGLARSPRSAEQIHHD